MMTKHIVGHFTCIEVILLVVVFACCLPLCSCSIKLPWDKGNTAVTITMSDHTPVESFEGMLNITRKNESYYLLLQSEITISNNTESEILLTDFYWYNSEEDKENNKVQPNIYLASDDAKQQFRPSESNVAIPAKSTERLISQVNMGLSENVVNALKDSFSSLSWEQSESSESQNATLPSRIAYSQLEKNHLGFFTTDCIYLHSDSDEPTILRRITTSNSVSDIRLANTDRYFTFEGNGTQRITPYCNELYKVEYLLVDADEKGMPLLTQEQYQERLDKAKMAEK